MSMRGALINIFTGLVLGVALAGLIHAPTQLVAQQEARTPVVRPKGTTAGPWVEEQTVRLSPKVERELERQRTRRLRPKTVRSPKRATADPPSVVVRATVPETPIASPTAQPSYADAKLKPKPNPKEKAPPKGAPPPAPPPKGVASAPQPADEATGKKPKKPKKPKKSKKPKKQKKDKKPKKDKADKKSDGSPEDHGGADNTENDQNNHEDD
jgi:hypothetical protein